MFSSAAYCHMIFVQFLEHHQAKGWEVDSNFGSRDKDQSVSASSLLYGSSNQDTSISWNSVGIGYDYRLEVL